jgi:WD40 repeat protein
VSGGRAVFVSYDVRERGAVEEIVSLLRTLEGIDVWLDSERVGGGDSFVAELNRALTDSDVVIAVFGRYRRRGWSERELEAALDMAQFGRLTIVPVVVAGHPTDDRGTPDRSDWPLLRGVHYVDFRGGAGDAQARQRLARAMRSAPGDLPPRRAGAPYPGLRAYGPDDRVDFLGRDAEVDEVIERLGHGRFLAIVGASGSGKTSLIRAGVLPALPGVRGPDGPWQVDDLPLPSRDGTATPTPATPAAGTTPLLVVDEMESLFVDRAPGVAAAFVDRLAEAVADPAGTRVVAALRADFLGDALALPKLRDLLDGGQYLLGPLAGERLREAIVEPARGHRVRFEPGLVDRILRDYGERPGSLPLLNETLRTLWEECEGPSLTLSVYEGRIGGLAGALVGTAERAWTDLAADDRATARAVLVHLALPRGLAGAAVSRARAERDLAAGAPRTQVHHVVESLVAARLLQTSSDHDGDGDGDDRIVDVVHDALFEAWPRLSGWLTEDAADIAALGSLQQAVDDWTGHGRDGSYLYQGTKLAGAADLADRLGERVGQGVRDFLDASATAEAAERDQAARRAVQTRRRRRTIAGLSVFVTVAVVTAVLSVAAWRATDRARAETQAHRLAAEAGRRVATDRDTALLLAAEAVERSDAVEPLGTLLAVLGVAPLPARQARRGDEGPVALAAAPDGGSVVVGTATGGIEVLRVDTPTVEPIGKVSTRPVVAAEVLRSGEIVALDDAGVLSRLGPGGPVAVLATFDGSVEGIAVDATTGTTVAAVDRDVVVLDGQGARRAHWPLGPPADGYEGKSVLVALSPDGRTVVVADARRLLVADLADPAAGLVPVTTLPGAAAAVAVDTVSNRLAVGDDTGKVTLVGLSDRDVVPTQLSTPARGVHSLAFSPDGASLAGANDAGQIVTWDLGRAAVTLGPVESRPPATWAGGEPAGSAVTDLAFLRPDMLVSLDDEAVVWWRLEPAAGLAVERWPVTGSAVRPAATADGEPVTVSDAGVVSVGGRERPELGTAVTAVAVGGGGIATGSGDGTVRVEGSPVAEVGAPIAHLAAADDGALLVAGAEGAWVVPAPDDARSEPGRAAVELAIGGSGPAAGGTAVTAVAVSGHGDRLAVAVDGPEGPLVQTWRRTAGGAGGGAGGAGGRYRPGPTIGSRHVVRIDALAFDEDGRLLTGSDDRTVRIVGEDGDEVQVLGGYGDGVISLVSDGDQLWTSTQNGEVHAWREQAERYVRIGGFLSVDVSKVQLTLGRHGELVVATSTTVRSWGITPERLIAQACQLAGRRLTAAERRAVGIDEPRACA